VVVDKYVVDDFERGAALDLSRPLVVADGVRMPFADHAFAYAIASHVLEHATDPAAFAAELARVSERGFVQVPSAVAELTFGWPFHPWLVERRGDRLRFTPRGEARAPYGSLFHALYADSALFRLFWGAHRSVFHISVEWEGSLAVQVAGAGAAERTADLDVERTVTALRAAGAAGRVRGPEGPLRAALRCPACRSALADATGALQCTGCGRAFPLAGPVPVLVEEAVLSGI
jgi:hypothetical protein